MIGRLLHAHGVHGDIKTESMTWVKDRFAHLEKAWLCRPGAMQLFVLAGARRMGGEWLLRFEGIDSPEAAKIWHGSFLCVSDDEVKRPVSGWVAADLPGMKVADETGAVLGEAVLLEELPAGPAILCRGTDGSEVLLPLQGTFSASVDALSCTVSVTRETWEAFHA